MPTATKATIDPQLALNSPAGRNLAPAEGRSARVIRFSMATLYEQRRDLVGQIHARKMLVILSLDPARRVLVRAAGRRARRGRKRQLWAQIPTIGACTSGAVAKAIEIAPRNRPRSGQRRARRRKRGDVARHGV
jgi:hypothetical protein